MKSLPRIGTVVMGVLLTLLLTVVPAMGVPRYPPNPPQGEELSRNGGTLGEAVGRAVSGGEALGEGLAFTGADVALLGGLVALLTIAGTVVLIVARRRAAVPAGW